MIIRSWFWRNFEASSVYKKDVFLNLFYMWKDFFCYVILVISIDDIC